MRKFLLSVTVLLSIFGTAQALRLPMNGKFGIKHVMSCHNNDTQLDSIKVFGEWGGWVDSSSFFHYDQYNRLLSAEGYNGNNMLVSKVKVNYNENGSFTLEETETYDGKTPAHIFTYLYDKEGNIKQMKVLTVESNVYHTTNVIYKKKHGEDNIICVSKDGGENSTTILNDEKKISSIIYPDCTEKYTYNSKGDLLSINKVENGNTSTIFHVSYKYGKNDKPCSLTSFKGIGVADSVHNDLEYNDENQIIRCINGSNYSDFTYTNDGRALMESRVDGGNIYGAKNKVYFYHDFAEKQQNAHTAYDLSRYPKGSAVATYGKLMVQNGKLCDQNGNMVQLRGMSTHGVQWFSNIYVDPTAISTLVDKWNINVLRVAMYVQESGYATNAVKSEAEWNTYIDSVSSLCAQKGIYCIIDWHILTPGDPLATCNYKDALSFWNYMSKKHAGDAHVLYEICNEPNGSDVSWPRVREYGRKIISEIRKNDPNTVTLVGTPVWSQDVDVASLAQINDADVMYTLHFYSGSHGKPFRQRGDRAMAAPYNCPIFITEFGTSDASGDNGFFKDATITWLTWASKNNLSWCNWSFADKGESSGALIKPKNKKDRWLSVTQSGALIRSILKDPNLFANQDSSKKK